MNFTKILFSLFLGIFIISTGSALSSVYGDFLDGTHSATINDGNSISFNADFGTIDKPMSISAKLFNSNDDVIYVFEDKSVNDYTFSGIYSITKNVYVNSGTYHVLLTATDRSGYSTGETLTLTVNPVTPPTPPANSPPLITSTPITQINEGNFYSYDVNANDADGDTLNYLLITAPNWLSMNTGTGVITGTSPLVSSNTNYNIVVSVSDGINPVVTQSYILTLNDVPSANSPPVITSSPVTSINEGANYNYDVNANDANGDSLTYSLVSAPSWLSINSATGLITGTSPLVSSNTNYNIVVSVSDGTASVTQSYTLNVDNISSGSKGSGGIREIDTPQPVKQKQPTRYIPITTKKTNLNVSTLIIFYTLTIFISIGIFFVTYLLVKNLRNRNKYY